MDGASTTVPRVRIPLPPPLKELAVQFEANTLYEFGTANKSQGYDDAVIRHTGGDMTTINKPNFDPTELNRMADYWAAIIDEIDDNIAAMQREREGAIKKITACAEAMAIFAEVNQSAKPSFGIHSHIDPQELAHCETHILAAKEIAKRSGGRIKLADAARLIYAAGLSEAANYSSVRSSLFSQMSISNEWESEGKGTGFYRLLTDVDKSDDAPASTPAEPAQSVLLSTDARKQQLQSALEEVARVNGNVVSKKLIRDALRQVIGEWDTSGLTLKSGTITEEAQRWMVVSGHWQFEAPDTFRLRISEADLTRVNIPSITAPRSG